MKLWMWGVPEGREASLGKACSDQNLEMLLARASGEGQDLPEDLLGVVVFEDPDGDSRELVKRLSRYVRQLDVPFVVVGASFDREDHKRIATPEVIRVCDPDTSDERIITEILSAIDIRLLDVLTVRLVEILQPFTAAAMEAALVLAEADLKATGVRRREGFVMDHEVSASIRLLSDSERMLVVSANKDTFGAISERILGRGKATEEQILDSAAEFVNIVAGQVMGVFSSTPYAFGISIPETYEGPKHEVSYDEGLPAYVIDMESEVGPLTLQLCFSRKAEEAYQ